MYLQQIIVLLICFVSVTESQPIANTTLGFIRGSWKKSFNGTIFSAFEGIPYAIPPIGSLRFEEPQPIKPWPGIWDAVTRSRCLQRNIYLDLIVGEEDCLHINVYVPGESPKPRKNLDVIVHIHGGNFMYGSGHDFSGPEYLLTRDIIFVTFNYRLGILGFLSTDDETLPGNNGLKDQILALKWIKTNIKRFGGNPDSITLTGQGSGAACVHLHYLSPLSRGLFHRGISHSGSALNPNILQKYPLAKAEILAQSLGCPTNHTQYLIECLKARSGRQIVSKLSLYHVFAGYPLSPFAPVIDKVSPNPFLPKHPFYLMNKKISNDVPWIASVVRDEGLIYTLPFVKHFVYLDKNWMDLAPVLLRYNYTYPKCTWRSTAREIKVFYLGELQKFNFSTFNNLSRMFGDRYVKYDIETAVKVQSRTMKSRVYFYTFNYKGNNSMAQLIKLDKSKINVETVILQGDDNLLLYPPKFLPENILSENDVDMINNFLDFYVTFASTGIPKFGKASWEPLQNGKLYNLNIMSLDKMEMVVNKELSPRKFWNEIGFWENQMLFPVKYEL